MVTINCKNSEIHDTVKFGKNVKIICDNIKIGAYSKFGDNISITCRSLDIGKHLFMADGVEIGRGGSNGPNSTVKIGHNVGIFDNTVINPSENVEIGDNTGIGSDVMIWTHGAWLDVTQGFPSDFGPVSIGKNVWLPARSIVLPNVKIGDNTVIGIGSIVNRNIPAGSLAAGSPCKVIKKNYYPQKVTDNKLNNLAKNILLNWKELMEYKGVKHFNINYKLGQFILYVQNEETVFNIIEKTVTGSTNSISEDFRDYLRRRGIKIYTNSFFKSLPIDWELPKDK